MQGGARGAQPLYKYGMRIALSALVMFVLIHSSPAEARVVARVPPAEVVDVEVRGGLTEDQVRAAFVAATEAEGFHECRVAGAYRRGGIQWLWLTGTVDVRGRVSGLRVLRSEGTPAPALRCWTRGLRSVVLPTAAETTTFVVELR